VLVGNLGTALMVMRLDPDPAIADLIYARFVPSPNPADSRGAECRQLFELLQTSLHGLLLNAADRSLPNGA